MSQHMIKIGAQYLTADGTLSTSQKDALRVTDLTTDDRQAGPRLVKLRPKVRTTDNSLDLG